MFQEVFDRLYAHFGPRRWWPAETPFEVVVGAILTQAVAWRNVERAIGNLKREGLLDPFRLDQTPEERLAELVRPALYYRQKAKRLKAVTSLLVREFGGSVERMLAGETAEVRRLLLSIPGIGPETADSILLYAGSHPIFVVDAYTRRLFHRMGVWGPAPTYEAMQALFHRELPADVQLFNEYHALIVAVGHHYCRASRPRCRQCPLAEICAHGRAQAP